MYLEYDEYKKMGGTLDSAAFTVAERKARQLINAQTGGRTGIRIDELAVLPQPVKDCTFDLVSVISERTERQVSSESQSQGGVSESVSYVTKTDEQTESECESIIFNNFYGGGIGYLLYRGTEI